MRNATCSKIFLSGAMVLQMSFLIGCGNLMAKQGFYGSATQLGGTMTCDSMRSQCTYASGPRDMPFNGTMSFMHTWNASKSGDATPNIMGHYTIALAPSFWTPTATYCIDSATSESSSPASKLRHDVRPDPDPDVVQYLAFTKIDGDQYMLVTPQVDGPQVSQCGLLLTQDAFSRADLYLVPKKNVVPPVPPTRK